MKEKTVFKDTVCTTTPSKELLKKLENTLEIRILDSKGKRVMTFWKE
jgi:hypothetical protein